MLQAIFFDFNGVIIDDERIHLTAYREVLESVGVSLTDDDYFASLGMDDVAFVKAAFGRGGHTLTDDVMTDLIAREHARHRELITADLPVRSGTVAFIKEASRYYELGIVSMAIRSEIDYVLGLAGLSSCISIFVSAADVAHHKPAPDCYLRALEWLNDGRRTLRKLPALAKECLVFEDAPPGIESARAAGMRTVGLTTTVTEAELRRAGADIVTPDLADWSVAAVHGLFG